MSLQDFIQQKNKERTSTTIPTTKTSSPSGSLSSFMEQKQSKPFKPTDYNVNPPDYTANKPKEEKKSKIGDAFSWIGKQLMKGQGIAAKEQRAIGEGVGNLLAIASPRVSASEGVKNAIKKFTEGQKGAYNVLRGREETSILQEMEDAGVPSVKFDKIFGITNELTVDPLNFLKPLKLIDKALDITKLKDPLQVITAGVKEMQGFKKVKGLFSNATGNKAFDNVVTKFRNLKDYREGELIKDAVDLQKDIRFLEKSGIKNAQSIITEGLENPTSLLSVTDEKMLGIIGNLKTTYKGLLDQSAEVGLKVGEIMDYAPHIRTKKSFLNKMKQEFGMGAREFGIGAVEKGRKIEGTIKEIAEKGLDIFEKNPAIQLAKKGQTFAKAITAKEFANTVKTFAVKEGGVEVTNSLLKGLKFSPEQAKVIDNFYSGIKPEELKVIIKGFDKVQNLWKAQALISPSYHTRNMIGNLWNNYLAGVNPLFYSKAGLVQKGLIKDPKLIEQAKRLGVLDDGWFAKDIADEIVSKVEGVKNWKKGLNPLSQQNYLIKLNRKIGSTVENNARLAHYMSKIAEGVSPEVAARSVKKYLFDYGDLTTFEKTIMKRIAPFYTWSRKNLPVQMTEIVAQPAKFALPHKIIERLEAGVEAPNEKYMSPYIQDNVPVRIRTNKDGNAEYFLLGSWLPYASAIEILSSPIEEMVAMITPFVKTPYEYLSNKSTFFKNTLGEPAPIERRHKQQGEFVNPINPTETMSMRKKNILLLRNIRVLNDMNKWVDKQDPTKVKDSFAVKALNTLFGKASTYDVGKSKYYYDMDTEDRITELKGAIRDASKRGFGEKAEELREELIDFQQRRQND